METFAPCVGVIAAAHVVVQNFQRKGDDQSAAVSMHDGFGQAGGATRINHPQRMIKRQGHGFEVIDLWSLPQRRFRKANGCSHFVAGQICNTNVVVHNHMLHGRQRVFQLLHHTHAVIIFTAVGDAIASNQNLRFNLLKAIEHRQCAHVGRANAPNTAHTDGGQKSNDGFGNVG